MNISAGKAAGHPGDRAQLTVSALIAAMAFSPILFDDNCTRINLPSAAIKIDPNTASREELMLLPGIGPVLADSIVSMRGENEPFKFGSVDALDRVPRIGPKTIEKLRPHVAPSDYTPAAPK